MRERVEEILTLHVRPALWEHCGEVEVTEILGGAVHIRLTGECASCASAYYTVDELIEKTLKHYIPEVDRVVLDTFDHELYRFAKQILHGAESG